jgi:Nitrous oxide-stimulated promoter
MNATVQILNTAGSGTIANKRKTDARLAREFGTIKAMVQIYCRDHHGHDLCSECQGLMDYAGLRLQRCRFGAEKPTCAKCPVHCYQRNRREQVKIVMRYAGPRMLWEHPILSLRHWLDGFHRLQQRSRRTSSEVVGLSIVSPTSAFRLIILAKG